MSPLWLFSAGRYLNPSVNSANSCKLDLHLFFKSVAGCHFFSHSVFFWKPELQSHVSKANSERFSWFKMFHWVRHKLGKQEDLKTFAQEAWLPGYRAWVRKDRFSFFLLWVVPRIRPSFPRHHLTCVQTISCGVHADLEKSCCCLVTQLCLTLRARGL